MSDEGPFAAWLPGSDDVPPALRRQFLQPVDPAQHVVLDGTMERIWHRPAWLRPFLWLTSRLEMLFPETGENVPTQMLLTTQRRRGKVVQSWDRRFDFGNRQRRFVADVLAGRAAVLERFALGGALELEWSLRFEAPRTIHITGDRWRLRAAGIGIPLPLLLCGRIRAAQWAHEDNDTHVSMRMVVEHPVLGEVFGYNGTFEVREEPATL